MHKFIYGWAYIRVGLYTGGLIFGMVRVLVNWWAYTWGAYTRGLIFGGLRYIDSQENDNKKTTYREELIIIIIIIIITIIIIIIYIKFELKNKGRVFLTIKYSSGLKERTVQNVYIQFLLS